jgi:phosphotransferase system enzyme I (PtsI)
MADLPREGESIYRGIPVSGGVCRGRIVILGRSEATVTRRTLDPIEVAGEIGRLEQALIETRHQLTDIQGHVTTSLGMQEAGIFDAHLLVLDDPVLLGEVTRVITEENVCAEFAFHSVATKYIDALSKVADDFLRERVADIKDVSARVLNNLVGHSDDVDVRNLKEPCLILAHDLSPSITAQLDKTVVLGFATDIGGKTSHTAIMARSLGIPAVVGLQSVSRELRAGEQALLDGYNGVLILRPSDQTLFEYGQLVRRKATLQEKLCEMLRQPAITLDGQRIILSANIEHRQDTAAVLASGAEGVGLFRTEYLYIEHACLPTEAEQYDAYRAVAAACKPHPVVIRSLDLGGDKFVSHLKVAPEMNPFLGWRAIRFCLAQKDIFRAQLRAILRASVEGNVKLMYPMISALEELLQATALLEQCKAELRAEGQPFDEALEVGAMIETPSAALIADALGRRLKFFSIGSNDLIQYTLAADRTNERVAHLYAPTHPAIVRLIRMTVEAARQHGIWTGVCGEVASDPALVPLLLGLGVDELSVAPGLLPHIKFLIRRLKCEEVRRLADFALTCESGTEILARTTALAHECAPGLFENGG